MAKSKNSKKKILTALGIIGAVLILGSVLYLKFKPPAALEIASAAARVGDITQLLGTTGKVTGENHGNFDVLSGMKVLEVNVKVGERVTAGQVLAAFDESTLNSQVAEKQAAYNVALSTYENSKAAAATAKSQLAAAKERLAEIDKEIAAAQSASDTSSKAATLPETLLSSITGLLRGDISQVAQGLQSVTSLLGGGSALGFDMSALTGSSTLEMEKMQLQLQQTVLEAQAGNTLGSVYQSLADTAKTALDETKAVTDLARGGWVAEKDGIVREINVVPGEVFVNEQNSAASAPDISSILALVQGGGTAGLGDLLASMLGGTGKTYGMSLEYYPFTAAVVFNKYDVLKVKVGQKATITTPSGGLLEGELTFISPVADSASGSVDISAIIGTGSSEAGVAAKISIPEPDSSVIIGLDVGISLEVNSTQDAVLIPIEAVMRDENGHYVWKYNADTKTAEQVPVELGLLDKSSHQVLSGLSEGDVILTQVPPELTADRKVKLK
ncbi:MAG: biotin/lipoyl-binding protein [Oscillospiraceae bacterium]|nr:biotin/lipoyl-binding protein [Oscillospiraceae bacterium]